MKPKHFFAGMAAMCASLAGVFFPGSAEGVTIPLGADPAPYKLLGLATTNRAFVKRVQGTAFDYVSAIRLGKGWFLTSAHAVYGTWGTATLTEVGEGPNPTTNPGPVYPVTEQHINPAFSPSNGFDGKDYCVFYAPSSPTTNLPPVIIGDKPTSGANLTFVGYGYLAQQDGYSSPTYNQPLDQDVAAWNAVFTSAVPLNTSSTYYYGGNFSVPSPIANPGLASYLNSGSTVILKDPRNDLVGMATGVNSSSSETIVLDLTHPEVKTFIRQYVNVVDRSSILPKLAISLPVQNSAKLQWSEDAIGFKLQYCPDLSQNYWLDLTPSLSSAGSYDFSRAGHEMCFFRLAK